MAPDSEEEKVNLKENMKDWTKDHFLTWYDTIYPEKAHLNKIVVIIDKKKDYIVGEGKICIEPESYMSPLYHSANFFLT